MQDILIRYKRMQGYNALWQPGTDHASIATEVRIIEKLKEEGIDKAERGRFCWSQSVPGPQPSGEVSREARSMGVLVMVWEVLIGSGPDASPSVAGWVPVPLSGVAPLLPDCPGILPEKEIAGREEVRALGETKTPLAAETLPPAEVWEAAMEEDWRPGRI